MAKIHRGKTHDAYLPKLQRRTVEPIRSRVELAQRDFDGTPTDQAVDSP